MELSEQLLCLFSASVSESADGYTVEVPKREVETGDIEVGESYRVALIDGTDTTASTTIDDSSTTSGDSGIRYVEIEDIGKQGDGIARVERGYVIIVPGAEIDERVKIEVSEVKSNFAVGEIIEEDF